MDEMFYFFCFFYSALDLNNQKILCLTSIFQFDRTVHNLNHPREGGVKNPEKLQTSYVKGPLGHME